MTIRLWGRVKCRVNKVMSGWKRQRQDGKCSGRSVGAGGDGRLTVASGCAKGRQQAPWALVVVLLPGAVEGRVLPERFRRGGLAR